MKELLTYIVQSLVDNPDEVSVTERKADGETVYEVRVADGDMGKVIGRQGRIVKQIRILMRAVAQRKGKKISVEDFDGYFFALSLGYGPHKNTNLLYDSPLPANDLAHIAVSHTDLKHGLAVGFALGHRNLVGIINKALYNIGQ